MKKKRIIEYEYKYDNTAHCTAGIIWIIISLALAVSIYSYLGPITFIEKVVAVITSASIFFLLVQGKNHIEKKTIIDE